MLVRRAIVISVLLIVISGLFFSWRFFKQPMAPSVQFISIQSGTTADKLIDQFNDLGLVSDPLFMRLYLTISGHDRHIQAGTFQIDQGSTTYQLIHRLITGYQPQKGFTFIEGWRLDDLLSKMANDDWFENIEHINWTKVIDPSYLDKESYEGLFMPDTYAIHKQENPEVFLRKSHIELLTYLNRLWDERDQSLPYQNPYEALIVASMLEKETAYKPERPQIAGLIIQRLAKKMPLGVCSTVLYAIPGKQKVHFQDTKIESPYNTYRHRGLPPTPISMVSRNALWASFHPVFTEELYYVSMNNGQHYFSRTYQEHKKARIRYQQ
mgnify:CR=1 FL=1